MIATKMWTLNITSCANWLLLSRFSFAIDAEAVELDSEELNGVQYSNNSVLQQHIVV